MLSIAAEGTDRIAQVTRTLLAFARANETTAPAAVPTELVVEGAMGVVQLTAEERGIALRHDVVADLPPVHIAASAAMDVIVNLLNNAIDASPRGSEVTLRARATRGGVELRVEDRGSGIDPKTLDRIFEPFFTTKGEGTGLGLAMARRIVEAARGAIRVKSEIGTGTTFTVALPAVKQPTVKLEPAKRLVESRR